MRVLAAGLVGALGCRADATGVADPPDLARAVPLGLQPPYALWWSLTEACSGLRGDLQRVRFALVPGTESLAAPGGGEAGGFWLESRSTILLAEAAVLDGPSVRHEMLHALLRSRSGPAHPIEFYGRRCAGVVACGSGECARDIAGQPAPPSAGARTVAASELQVQVAALPSNFPADSNGGFFAVEVTATNPLPEPVWVGVEGRETAGFGFRTPDVLEWGLLSGRLLLQPGETRRAVFDVTTEPRASVRSFVLPGVHTLRGHFGDVTTAPVTLTIRPPGR